MTTGTLLHTFYKETLGAGGAKSIADKDVVETLSDSSIICNRILVTPYSSNTKPIHLKGDELITNDYPDYIAGVTYTLNCQDPYELYVKVEVDGEGCKWQVIV